MGFQKSDADPNLYFIVVGEDPLILVLYVDDLFITREERLISTAREILASEFDMTNMGLMHYFLGWRFGRRMDISSWDRGSM
jgi:hypothetical protein